MNFKLIKIEIKYEMGIERYHIKLTEQKNSSNKIEIQIPKEIALSMNIGDYYTLNFTHNDMTK
jgi:hypothetical protein